MNTVLINTMQHLINSANLNYYDHTDTYKNMKR